MIMAANISIQCPTCGKRGEAPAEYEGRTASCNECGTKFRAVAVAQDVISNSETVAARGVGADGVPLEWQVGDKILDLYAVNHVFTSGGMGLVYRVHHQSWNVDLAVKSPRPQFFQTEAHKQNFVSEAQTWVNLGMHPHIASCFYVRTLGGIPRVFAEYIEGGSLSAWIKSRKLYEGSHGAALERILDIAIQFAWGLHYAHEQGLVHQDVKPANVLMTADGTAKVSDFGLAKARASTGETQTMNRGGTTMVTSGGLTPAYASPEQVGRAKLTRRTDMWSWAVSVLEMFTGEITWMSGSAAGEALEAYGEEDELSELLPAMPAELAALLRRCFENDPAARPATMQVVADDLRGIYRSVVGKEYPRAAPQPLKARADVLNNKAVSLIDLGQRNEAEKVLEEALKIQVGHQQASYNLAVLLWQAGRATDDKVIQTADEEHKAAFKQLQKDLLVGRAPLDHEFEQKPLCALTLDEAWGLRLTRLTPHGLQMLALNDGNLSLWDLIEGKEMQSQSVEEKYSLEGRYSTNSQICFDATGRFVLSCDETRVMRLWDIQSDQCSREWYGVSLATLSPDARFTLSSTHDAEMILWDVENDNRLGGWQKANISSMAFSPDSNQALIIENITCAQQVERPMVTGNNTATTAGDVPPNAHLINIPTCERVRAFTIKGDVSFVAFSPNGECFVTCGDTLNLWDATSLCQVRSFEGHQGELKYASFSSNSKKLLSVGEDEKPRLWDVESGQCLHIFEDHRNGLGILHASISGNGSWVLSSGCDETRLWNLDSARPVVAFALAMPQSTQELFQREREFESALATSREAEARGQFAQAMIAVRQAQNVRGYERVLPLVETVNRVGLHGIRVGVRDSWLIQNLRGHTDEIWNITFSPNGRLILSGSQDETLRLWDVKTGMCKWASERLGREANAIFSPDGRQVLLVDEEGARLLDVKTGQCVKNFPYENVNYRVGDIAAFSPDGKYIVITIIRKESHSIYSVAPKLLILDVEIGQYIRVPIQCSRAVQSLAFSPDGMLLFIATDYGVDWMRVEEFRLRRRNLRSCEIYGQKEGLHQPVQKIFFSPNGSYLIGLLNSVEFKPSKKLEESIQIWDVATLKIVHRFAVKNLTFANFSPDRKFVIHHDEEGHRINLINSVDGKNLCNLQAENEDIGLLAPCMSPDGNLVACGSSDNNVRVWQLDWNYEFPNSR